MEKPKYEACSACGFWKDGCLTKITGQSCTVEVNKKRILSAVKRHRNVYKLLGDPQRAA